ncbi:MAG: IS110 family transposase, partial [Gammaproteobacteria bacterium]
MKAFYQQLKNAGKASKVALVAVMRKIIITLNAMVRDKKPWQENNPLAALSP